MHIRYRDPVPLSLLIPRALESLRQARRTGEDARAEGLPLHTPPVVEDWKGIESKTCVSAVPSLDPGCSVPVVGMVLVLLALALMMPGTAAGQTVLSENFDSVVAPAVPSGWAAGTGWATSTSSESNGSGGNNLAHTGTGAADVMTPSIDLTGRTTAQLAYLARRTSSYPAESLAIDASLDGGVSWTAVVLDAGLALPAATSTWSAMVAPLPAGLMGHADVRLRFRATGGTTSGANVRVDDVVVSAEAGGGSSGGSTFGFATGSSSVPDLSSTTIETRLSLDAAEGLGALQFDVSWADGLLTWAGVQPGPAISNAADWTITAESGDQLVSVLVVSTSGASLAPGTVDPIVSLQFDVGALPGGMPVDVDVAVSSVIGALSMPTGDDADLTISIDTHTVSVYQQAALFEAPANVNLGTTPAGTPISGTIPVTNGAGASNLVISGASVDDPDFAVHPETAVIAPGATVDFTVTFSPDSTLLGERSASASFTHDGSNGPTSVVGVTARAGAGQGDANGDTVVDLLDLLVGIDIALKRLTPQETVLESLDLYPYGSADGVIDVRDLTVLVHAIVGGLWPDGTPLSDLPAPRVASKSPGSASVATITLSSQGDGVLVGVRTRTPVRGIQFELLADRPVAPEAIRSESSPLPVHVGQVGSRIRFVMVHLDGSVIPAGEWSVAAIESVDAREIKLERSVVVADGNVVSTAVLSNGADVPDPDDLRIGSVYPNPFLPEVHGHVRIPVAASGSRVDLVVIDLLGREVARLGAARTSKGAETTISWDGTDSHGQGVTPGLYFIRASRGGGAVSRPFVVSR